MMVTNLGWATDLMFLRWLGEVEKLGGYTRVRTPSNPTFHWGNFLYFDGPPQPGDEIRWRKAFAREFPGRNYEAIGWESESAESDDVSAFERVGLRREVCSVMTGRAVNPPAHRNADVLVRALETDADWAQMVENQVACRGAEYEEAGFRVFKEAAARDYRKLQSEGQGAWFGAFLGERLVADCGLFFDGSLGRFQSVGTHPEYRRRGICQTLVHSVARHGFDEWGLETLVIVAEDDQPAGRIYGSLGFSVTEKQVFLYRYTG
jgi:ribosomal protein S18 acetylase RimI-like enzyme